VPARAKPCGCARPSCSPTEAPCGLLPAQARLLEAHSELEQLCLLTVEAFGLTLPDTPPAAEPHVPPPGLHVSVQLLRGADVADSCVLAGVLLLLDSVAPEAQAVLESCANGSKAVAGGGEAQPCGSELGVLLLGCPLDTAANVQAAAGGGADGAASGGRAHMGVALAAEEQRDGGGSWAGEQLAACGLLGGTRARTVPACSEGAWPLGSGPRMMPLGSGTRMMPARKGCAMTAPAQRTQRRRSSACWQASWSHSCVQRQACDWCCVRRSGAWGPGHTPRNPCSSRASSRAALPAHAAVRRAGHPPGAAGLAAGAGCCAAAAPRPGQRHALGAGAEL
jgi:hypothetical protein